eukprot:CAMPEP_0198140132 /NCGR_PEP_ID=MMETSP1443-20131203/3338_1 /TAXON_ID=186043 /ORGANISM="Entomoneis sp., Strain CCMP2396" /LENGTH=467 /DNA_ID=CAMNT_0043802469 /DNA_START=364 /DNA_END=1763 /DNA_ORIENTATION=-
MTRMDVEWDDYQWQLKQHDKRKVMGKKTGDDIDDDSVRTIAIDLGSIYTKLASSHPKPEVIVSRQGHRSFFNGILYDENLNNVNTLEDGPPVIRGQAALDKFFYGNAAATEQQQQPCPVLMPYLRASYHDGDDDDGSPSSLTRIIQQATIRPLQESLERLDYAHLQQVVTVPVQLAFMESSRNAIINAFASEQNNNNDGETNTTTRTIVVPDAVASVWGAQREGLLPSSALASSSSEKDHDNDIIMVIDMGGFVTQFSIVQRDVVVKSLALPMGGETVVELLQDYLRRQSSVTKGTGSSTETTTNDSKLLSDARSLSALQIHARMAAIELSSPKSAVAKVHVPFLFPDPSNHHLDLTVSRSVVEGLLTTFLQENISEEFQGSLLSRHLPLPKDVPSLFSSILTELLEQSEQMPTSIDHILVVGGASRIPLFKQGLNKSLEMLTLIGAANDVKLIQPDTASLSAELTV